MSRVGTRTVRPSYVTAPALLLSSLLLVVQCGTGGVSSPEVRADDGQPPVLRELLHRGNAFFRSGEYLQAIQIYESGYKQAKSLGSGTSAVRFLNNLGSAHYEMFRYREAIRAYLEARDLAAAQGNREMLAALSFNLSSLYLQMGDVEAARESAEQGLRLPAKGTARFKAKLLIQCARVKREQNESGPAVALLRDAIKASRAQRDTASEAQAWDALGNTLLELGQFPSAEPALVEALRLRESTHDDHIYHSYESLGNLREAQGDLQRALALFDKAVDSAAAVSPPAMWRAYYARGKVKLAQTRLQGAFADFGAALQCARQWHAEVLPADAFRVSAEVELHQLYSSFIEVGSRLYAQTGQKRFVEQTFAAAEENRAASLRALWAGRDLTKTLPAEYWEALADLNKLEAGLLAGKSGVDMASVRQLRLKVGEMEARAALDLPHNRENPGPVDSLLLDRTRKTLRPAEVLLTFHLGESESCLWAIAREGFAFRRLPSRAYFAEKVSLLVKRVRENSDEAALLGHRLYTEIFGADKGLIDKPKWILAPDGPLFEMPFAALVQELLPPADIPLYVIERHVIQIIPGVSTLFGTTASNWNGPAIGVGDPIYNRADPRLPRRTSGSNAQVPPMELARLVGSGREIENCARIWRSHGHQPILLTGEAANRENLTAALRRNPAVLHISAHVLFPPQDSGPGAIALSLAPGGEIDFLSATEIARMRLNLGLVVLNGCSSAHAAILPGTGLMGMTRAYLAAGARAVIVTRWATSDHTDGELFQSIYNRFNSSPDLSHRRSFAELLQLAQIAELHSEGRRANPANWAAYFCVERN